VKVAAEAAECPHWIIVLIATNGNNMKRGSNVQPRV
jgi:hypothetical protein